MKKERKKRNRRKNVGNTDSILRVVVGSLILVMGVVLESWVGLLGVVLIVTGGIAWCPVYYVLGLRTCKTDLELEV